MKERLWTLLLSSQNERLSTEGNTEHQTRFQGLSLAAPRETLGTIIRLSDDILEIYTQRSYLKILGI